MKLDTSALRAEQIAGPHIAFIRTREFEEQEWEFIDLDRMNVIHGANNVVAILHSLTDIDGSNIPEWVDFLEVAAVGHDMAHAPHSPGRVFRAIHEDQEQDDGPSFRKIFQWLPVLSLTERPSFDRRMIVVCYGDDDTTEDCEAHNRRIMRALPRHARGVWHGKDAFAAYFRDARSPAQILEGLSSVVSPEAVYDAAIFKVIEAHSPTGLPGVLQAAIQDTQAKARR